MTPPPTADELKRARDRVDARMRVRFASELVLRGRNVSDAFQIAEAFLTEARRRLPPREGDDVQRERQVEIERQVEREQRDELERY